MIHRRALLAAGLAAAATPGWAANLFAPLEDRSGGRLGVFAIDLSTGETIAHRPDERFAMCSTFKALLAGAVLAKVDRGEERLDRPLPFGPADMISHAPVTETLLPAGQISVERACQAIVEVSDNPAANLLLRTVGGPEGFTAFLRGLGDAVTRLDRYELELNSAIEGDPRDTTTPRAMTATLGALLVGEALSPASRERLAGWMVASPTGARRLRKSLPAGWRAGDKTGTGSNGATNDVAIFWPPDGGPILAAAYLTATQAPLEAREAVLAEVGAAIVDTLGGAA